MIYIFYIMYDGPQPQAYSRSNGLDIFSYFTWFAPYLLIGGALFGLVRFILLFLLNYGCGFKHRRITGDTKVANLLKKIEYYESTLDDLPYGHFFGFHNRFYFGVIGVEMDGRRKNYSVDIFYRGDDTDIDYSETWIPILYESLSSCRQKRVITTPNKQQAELVAACLTEFRNRDYCKILIYGTPGSGKTFMRYALGLEYKTAHYYPNYNPNRTLFNFASIYNKVAPSAKKPLIISIDEIDAVIDKIMLPEDEKSEKFRDFRGSDYMQDVANKKEWCEFMDIFDTGIYPHVYILMTTNRDRKYFDSLDPAIFRDGRVNVIAEFK